VAPVASAVAVIGIRREDKSRWETRVPLVPDVVREAVRDHGLRFQVQSCPFRAFRDDAYRAAGATVVEDLKDCPIIVGVKEIPPTKLERNKTYLFFSHTIKGQPANMPMLRRLLDLGCTLIDYERIVDDRGRRLVFFGRYAGIAGMLDTLWALGQRLQYEGIESPFAHVRRAFEYHDIDHAKQALAALGADIRRGGLPQALRPLVCGFAGYGNVSQGAQEIYDLLPVRTITPQDLANLPATAGECYKVVFREEDMVELQDSGTAGPFDLQDYYQHPEKYRSRFFPYVQYVTILVNGIYWEPRYPRLVTRVQVRELYGSPQQPRLRVIGDISCDIEGSIECTLKATDPGDPVYVYNPQTDEIHMGVGGHGPVILAVDFLPCELPVDASTYFSHSLRPLLPALAQADFSGPLEQSGLPPELARATIVYKGKLTEPYRYLESKL
jgi:saccharopine dehydrogenase (NAD+, L-lysine-forming)